MQGFARHALRLLGAIVAGGLAILAARVVASQRPGNTVQPIEAAMIALAVTIGRDIADGLIDILTVRAERRRLAASLKSFLRKLTSGDGLREHLPYSIIDSLRASVCFRERLSENNFATALVAIEQSIVPIRAYAVYWEDISPLDRQQLSDNIEAFITVARIGK